MRKPLGSVGRGGASPLYNVVAKLLYPFARLPVTEEAVLHRGIFVLRKA